MSAIQRWVQDAFAGTNEHALKPLAHQLAGDVGAAFLCSTPAAAFVAIIDQASFHHLCIRLSHAAVIVLLSFVLVIQELPCAANGEALAARACPALLGWRCMLGGDGCLCGWDEESPQPHRGISENHLHTRASHARAGRHAERRQDGHPGAVRQAVVPEDVPAAARFPTGPRLPRGARGVHAHVRFACSFTCMY